MLRVWPTMSRLSNTKRLNCSICDVLIEVERDEAFNYNTIGDGPFCNQCFYFVGRIEALEEKIIEREKLEHISKDPCGFGRDRPNIYDCSRRPGRTTRGGGGP
jgi:hypothetical protein